MNLLTVKLPLPLPANDLAAHPKAQHHQKNRYRQRAWTSAIMGTKPLRDPWQKVRVTITYILAPDDGHDDDAYKAMGTKWVLDTLKQRQKGKLDWRQAYELCGFFIDDDPKHMELGAEFVLRTMEREPGVYVTISEVK